MTGRGLSGVLYDSDGNRKPLTKGSKQMAAFILLLPARIAVEALILPIRLFHFIDSLGPLGGSDHKKN